MEIKIATRACRDPEGADRTFTYYLTVDQEESPRVACENYGVRIVEEPERNSACLPGLTTSAARIDQQQPSLLEDPFGVEVVERLAVLRDDRGERDALSARLGHPFDGPGDFALDNPRAAHLHGTRGEHAHTVKPGLHHSHGLR